MTARAREVLPSRFGPAELYAVCAVCVALLAVAFYLRPSTAYLIGVALLGVVLLAIPLRPFLYVTAAALVLFKGSSYGLLVGDVSSLYSRGSGQFVFSLFEIALLVRLARELIGGRVRRFPMPVVRWSALALVALYLTQVAVAFGDGDVFAVAFDATGGRLLLTLAAVAWLVSSGFDTVADVARFLRFMVGLATVLAVVGLARYWWGGGDPANPYANFSGLTVKLTWFEEGFAYAMLLGLVALVVVPEARLVRNVWVNTAAGIGVFVCLVLTMRRENWIAIVCALVLVFILSRRGRSFAVFGAVATMFAVGPLLVSRGLSADAGGVLGHTDAARRDELTLARRAIDASPLGQGPQGAYVGHPPNWPAPPTVVHDAFLWLGLKLGWAGAVVLLVLLVAAGVAALRSAFVARDPLNRAVAVTLVAVYPFWLVAMAVGTPLLDPRLVGLFAFWLGLLAVVVRSVKGEYAVVLEAADAPGEGEPEAAVAGRHGGST